MLPPRMWPILSSRQFLAPSEASLHIVIVAAWGWEVVVPSRLCSHWGALLSAGWRFFMALSLGGVSVLPTCTAPGGSAVPSALPCPAPHFSLPSRGLALGFIILAPATMPSSAVAS